MRQRIRVLRTGTDMRREGKSFRRILWEEDSRCFWCGRKTKWHTPADGVQDNDGATLDHLISRNYRVKGEPCDVVLACYECNQRRNTEEDLDMPYDEKLRRSTLPPHVRKENEIE